MKTSLPWLATSILAVGIAISCYAAIRGALKSVDGGEKAAVFKVPKSVIPLPAEEDDSPATVEVSPPSKVAAAVVDAGKEQGSSQGIASFYRVSTNGIRTASGVPLNDSESTAAHRTLPFGTLVRVTNQNNGLSEIVKITDRGPFIKGRIIDVSRNAAGKLDMIKAGVVPVVIEVLHEAAKPPGSSLVEE